MEPEGDGSMRDTTRRRVLQAALAATAGATLAACGAAATPGGSNTSPTKGPVTLQILDRSPGDALIPDYDQILQGFTQAHPNVKVERLDTGGQDRDKKFQVLAAAGQPADVDWMD